MDSDAASRLRRAVSGAAAAALAALVHPPANQTKTTKKPKGRKRWLRKRKRSEVSTPPRSDEAHMSPSAPFSETVLVSPTASDSAVDSSAMPATDSVTPVVRRVHFSDSATETINITPLGKRQCLPKRRDKHHNLLGTVTDELSTDDDRITPKTGPPTHPPTLPRCPIGVGDTSVSSAEERVKRTKVMKDFIEFVTHTIQSDETYEDLEPHLDALEDLCTQFVNQDKTDGNDTSSSSSESSSESSSDVVLATRQPVVSSSSREPADELVESDSEETDTVEEARDQLTYDEYGNTFGGASDEDEDIADGPPLTQDIVGGPPLTQDIADGPPLTQDIADGESGDAFASVGHHDEEDDNEDANALPLADD